MDLRGSQIILPANEADRIGDKIWHDFIGARSNHDARIERFRRYLRYWRGLEMAGGNPDDGPAFEVPLLKWTLFGHWARIMAALLGDDAEIIAEAKNPEAMKLAGKVGHYMTWRFFEYMKAQPQLSAWVFRAILNGRAHAFCPYEQETYFERYDAKDPAVGKLRAKGMQVIDAGRGRVDVEVIWYDAPRLTSLYPSEIVLPAQDGVTSVDDHAFIMRRTHVSPQELLDGERAGIYQGVTEHWDEIISLSQQRQERNYWYDDEKIDVDEAEGITHATMLGNRDTLELWTWYSEWRMPTSRRNVRAENLRYRQQRPTEMLANYLPAMRKVIGLQDLRDIYPRMRKRRPFLDLALTQDGSYWGPGLGEMLESLQNKESANYALFEKAGKLSVGPLIFYRPGAGFDPDKFEYSPNLAIPSADPASVKVISMMANLDFSIKNQASLDSFAERVSGVSDQTLGRSIERPNAPQTATGQMALLEQGNVRAALDMTMLHEDFSRACEFIWLLDREYSDSNVFFRATEEDATGLYDVNDGFGAMTAEERTHGFDFQLKFATSVWSREADKQRLMQVYAVCVANPLIMQNPRALWVLMSKVWAAFGEGDFSEIIAKPPDLEQPIEPKAEWALALEGQELKVNPLDDDMAHVIRHRRDIAHEEKSAPSERDQRAIEEMLAHIVQHEHQRRMKMVMQAQITAELQRQQQAAMAGLGGQPPMLGGAQPPAPGGGAAPPPGPSPVPQTGPPGEHPAINSVRNAVVQSQPPALGGPPQ